MNKFVASLASLTVLCTPIPGAAGPRTMVVKVSDLDLASAGGAALALQRARMAARDYCGRGRGGRRAVDFDELKCRAQMVREAVDAMRSPLVTRFNRSMLQPELW